MEKELNKIEVKPIHILALLTIALFVAFIVFKRNWLLRNHRFTIGVTIGTESASRMGTYVDFTYNVSGIEYKGSRPLDGFRPESNGGRYYVMFSVDDPETEHILWDKPVPNSIKEAPMEGWSELPK